MATSYLQDLDEQVRLKKERARLEKEDDMATDARHMRQSMQVVANRGGGGDPIRDEHGSIVTGVRGLFVNHELQHGRRVTPVKHRGVEPTTAVRGRRRDSVVSSASAQSSYSHAGIARRDPNAGLGIFGEPPSTANGRFHRNGPSAITQTPHGMRQGPASARGPGGGGRTPPLDGHSPPPPPLMPGEVGGAGWRDTATLIPGMTQRDQAWEAKLAARRGRRQHPPMGNGPQQQQQHQYQQHQCQQQHMYQQQQPSHSILRPGRQGTAGMSQHELQALAAEALDNELMAGGQGLAGAGWGCGQAGLPAGIGHPTEHNQPAGGAGQLLHQPPPPPPPQVPQVQQAQQGGVGRLDVAGGIPMVEVDPNWIQQLLLDRDRLRRQLRDAGLHPIC